MDASPFIDKINATCGMVIALLSYALGVHWYLFIAYLGLNVADGVTGSIKAHFKGQSNSKKGLEGIIKKLGYWVMIMVAFGVGVIFIELGKTLNVDLSFTTAIGWLTLATLIINEIRSIIENFVEAGYDVPKILVKGLEVANKTLDDIVNEDTE